METNGSQTPDTLARSLEGLPCWYVSCGGAVGPSFSLALGKKIPRPQPLKNPAHTEEFRHFDGEAELLVWCSWRLDGPDGPLTSSDDTENHIQKKLGQLAGTLVEAVATAPPAWDLTIRFSGHLVLRVFCDHLPGEPSFDGNWELWLPTAAVFVGPGVHFTVEPHHEPVLSAGE